MPPDPTPSPIPSGRVHEPLPLGLNPINFVQGTRVPPGVEGLPTAPSNPSAYTLLATLPTAQSWRGLCFPSMSRETYLRYYASGGDAGMQFTSRVWGLTTHKGTDTATTKTFGEFLGDPICDLTLVLADTQVTGKALGLVRPARGVSIDKVYANPDQGAMARRSVWLLGRDSGGVAADDRWITVALDRTPGYFGFIVELIAGTASGAGFLYSG